MYNYEIVCGTGDNKDVSYFQHEKLMSTGDVARLLWATWNNMSKAEQETETPIYDCLIEAGFIEGCSSTSCWFTSPDDWCGPKLTPAEIFVHDLNQYIVMDSWDDY